MNRTKRIADILNVIMISLTILTPIICIGDTILSETGIGSDGEVIVEAIKSPSPSYVLFMGRLYILGIGIFIIMLTCYLSRVLIEKMWLYFVAHISLIILSVMSLSLSNSGIIHVSYSILFVILAFIVMFIDLLFWQGAVNEEKNLPVSESGTTIEGFKPIFKEGIAYLPSVFVVVYIAALIYAAWRSDISDGLGSSLYRLFYIFGIIFIALSYLRAYLKNLSDFIGRDRKGEHTPIKDMVLSSIKLTVTLILIVVAAMVLFQSDTVIECIDAFLKKIVDWISEIIARIMQSVSKASETEVMMESGAENMYDAFSSGGGSEQIPAWLDNLYNVMEKVISILLSVGGTYIIIRCILRFMSSNRSRSINKLNQDKLENMVEVRERVTVEKKARDTRKRAVTPAEKIRELYRRYIKGLISKGYSYSSSDTPYETAERLVDITKQGDIDFSSVKEKDKRKKALLNMIKDKDNMVNITQIYNQARYNDTSVTEKELAKFKEIM